MPCEELSKEPAAYNRAEKFDHYRRIPSLRHSVILDHARAHVDVYTLHPEAGWARRGYGTGEVATLTAIDVVLDVSALYDGWAEERAIDDGAAG